MNDPGAGFEYPPQDVSWLQRDVLLFANSIGCSADELHFLYELHPYFQAFPTYPIILPFKQTSTEVRDFYAYSAATPIPGVPQFDPRRVVDGQRSITFLKPLPTTSAGRHFEIRSKVRGVYDKGKAGSVVETETVLAEKGGEEFTRAVGSAFFVGQGNWGGPKGPPTINFPPPEGKEPDATSTYQTTNETALLYRLNGDYNPLHATPEPGRKMGFGGPILHGLFAWNLAAHALLANLGASDPANLHSFEARFASPVRPGDGLITLMWVLPEEGGGGRAGSEGGGGMGLRGGEGEGGVQREIRFVVRLAGKGKGKGTVVLSNGRAVMDVVGLSKRSGREREKSRL